MFSRLCVYTTTQTTKFPKSHLHAGGWYLDCSRGFVLGEEKLLFPSLVSSGPDENIVTFEEPDIVELLPSPPKAPKRKGRAKKTATQAFSQVVTRSVSKTPVEPPTFLRSPSSALSVVPTVVPSDTPSTFGSQSIIIHSHSGTSLLSLPRKRKAALLDTSATCSESPSTLALIENVDMVQLMLDSELAGGPFPAYTRIQEFIANVCIFPVDIFQVFFFLVCFFFFLALILMKF